MKRILKENLVIDYQIVNGLLWFGLGLAILIRQAITESSIGIIIGFLFMLVGAFILSIKEKQ